MLTVETATELRALLKRYIDAQAASTRAQDARARLQVGSTRARSTTASANGARAAEHRDRCADAVEAKLRALVGPPVAEAPKPAPPPTMDRGPATDPDLPPGFTRGQIIAMASRRTADNIDPCQVFVADLLPEGWTIETDCGPDIRVAAPGAEMGPWWKPRELGVKPEHNTSVGGEGSLLYVSDVRRMVRALRASGRLP